MSNQEQVNKAFEDLTEACKAFNKAMKDFKSVYNPKAVDLAGLSDDMADTMFEIEAEIERVFEDEDE